MGVRLRQVSLYLKDGNKQEYFKNDFFLKWDYCRQMMGNNFFLNVEFMMNGSFDHNGMKFINFIQIKISENVTPAICDPLLRGTRGGPWVRAQRAANLFTRWRKIRKTHRPDQNKSTFTFCSSAIFRR